MEAAWGASMEVKSVQRANGGAGDAGPAPALLEADVRVDNGMRRVCCGNLLRPRMAERRDPQGLTQFVVVWRCPTCGRVTL